MKISRRHLCDLPACYAAGSVEVEGRTVLLLAPDGPGPCYAFDSVSFRQETVWEEPGGTMGMIPLPGGGAFLAVQRFFPNFKAEDSELVRVRYDNGQWQTETLFRLPFLHRFLILERGGVYYLLCATLCGGKKSEDDWSSPGGLYAAELPEDFSGPVSLTRIAGGMTRNHGCWHRKFRDDNSALTSCDQGVYRILPPYERGGEWEIKHIHDRPVSDIALCDIDNDGINEIAAIESFHGDRFSVLKKTAGAYRPVYTYPGESKFLHAVWGGKLRGEPVFIGGARGGGKELFLLRWKEGSFIPEILEEGAGPANVHVINGPERDLILTANYARGEGAVFIVEDD